MPELSREEIDCTIGQMRSYLKHYELTCNAFETDKSGLANHVKQKRDEMLKESAESLTKLNKVAHSAITRAELLREALKKLELLKEFQLKYEKLTDGPLEAQINEIKANLEGE